MVDKTVLICDLDNTLYDWVGYFVPAFYAMADAVVEITGCDREKLLDDFREVHRASGTTEEPFALLKTDTIEKIYHGISLEARARELDPAFHAFNSVRKSNLKLYPNVRKTLDILSASGVKLIAHTESKLHGVVDRLTRLGVSEYFSKVYCRERSLSPHPVPGRGAGWLNRFPMQRVVQLSHHQAKPDPSVLYEIFDNEGVTSARAAYVGDSVARDVLMAKRAGVFAIWAAYGAAHDADMYHALVRISHWTQGEVERERKLVKEARTVEPDFIAYHSFSEILVLFGLREL